MKRSQLIASFCWLSLLLGIISCTTQSRYRIPDDARYTVPCSIAPLDNSSVSLGTSIAYYETLPSGKLSFQEMAIIESKILEVLEAHPDLQRKLDYRIARIKPNQGRAESFRVVLRFLIETTEKQ